MSRSASSRRASGPICLLGLALALALVPPAHAKSLESRVLDAVMVRDVYAQPRVASLVDQPHLAYAARIASRAADGAPIKVLFVNVTDGRLNGFRDRLFARMSLGTHGALVIATPASVTMRTHSLTPDQEWGIIALDSRLFRQPHTRYTDALAELVYDVGLVIHNSRPGVAPRGDGRDRNLSTFSGRFPGEGAARPPRQASGGGATPLSPTVLLLGAVGLALALLVAYMVRRARRLMG